MLTSLQKRSPNILYAKINLIHFSQYYFALTTPSRSRQLSIGLLVCRSRDSLKCKQSGAPGHGWQGLVIQFLHYSNRKFQFIIPF